MSEESATAEGGQATETRIAGTPEGVTQSDLNEGESTQGSQPPAAPSNEPPKAEPTAEEKEAAEKEAAKKADAEKNEAEAKEQAEKDAAEEAEKKKAQDEADKKEYPEYEDPSANAVVNILKKAKVTPEEADEFFRAAVESGKLEDIDVDKLAEKIGKDEADLVMIGVRDYYNKQKASVDKVVDEVYKVCGGETQFATLRIWALDKEKTDKEFSGALNEYRQMLNGTPTQARLAAEALIKAYNADPKTKSLSVRMTEGDKAGSEGLSLEYISRADYITQLTEAEKAKDQMEVYRLNARRKQSMETEKKRLNK